MKSNYKSKILYGLMLGLSISFGCSKEEELDTLDIATLQKKSSSSMMIDDTVNPRIRMKSNSYIVVSSSGTLPSDFKGQMKSLNAEVTGSLDKVGIATVSSTDRDFAKKARNLQGVGSVIRDIQIQWRDPQGDRIINAEAVNINPPSSGDDDPYFFLQWGHTAIQAPEAWNAGARGEGVRVAVLDTGFFPDHPDLKDNVDLAASASFVPEEDLIYRAADGFSHGTHVAGTIAALDNELGVIGVAPNAELILVKVLSDEGSGSFGWMLQGILHAVEQGADVINMSLGAGLPRNGKYLDDNGTPEDPSDDFVVNEAKETQELINAINKVTTYATQQGVTVISSAGNDYNNGNKDGSFMYIPAGVPNVISISSTAPVGWANDPLNTNLDGVASYTNYGTPDVDFAAPGGDFIYPTNEPSSIGIPVWALDMVLSTATRTGYSWSAGTSMASPHAAGVAALIIGQNGGDMDPKRVEAVLRASADDLGKSGRDPFYGHGRLNAYKAVTSGIQ